MIRKTKDNPTILVTDSSRGSAIAMIRCLGRRGWNVIAADSDPKSAGLRSKYARGRLVYPSPAKTPTVFVDAMLAAAEQRDLDLIIPVTDEVLLPLSKARESFAGICKLAIPDAEALDVTTNKLRTMQLARRLDVPTPQTASVETSEQAARQAENFQWPVVLKPLVSRLYRDRAPIQRLTVCYADSQESLARQMRRFEGVCPVLLQEYVSGTGYGVELLTYRGRPLTAFQHKRLREIPISGGASAYRESVPLDPVLYDRATRLMKALDWTGLAMVEFKGEGKDARLMEINGRVWGSLPLAVLSGIDFPSDCAELFLNGPPAMEQQPRTSYSVGVRSRNLELDLVWIASVLMNRRSYSFLPMPPRRQALAAVLGLLNPRNKFDIMSLRDIAPGMAVLRKIFHMFRDKMRDDATAH